MQSAVKPALERKQWREDGLAAGQTSAGITLSPALDQRPDKSNAPDDAANPGLMCLNGSGGGSSGGSRSEGAGSVSGGGRTSGGACETGSAGGASASQRCLGRCRRREGRERRNTFDRHVQSDAGLPGGPDRARLSPFQEREMIGRSRCEPPPAPTDRPRHPVRGHSGRHVSRGVPWPRQGSSNRRRPRRNRRKSG